MGARLRLRASKDLSGFSPALQRIFHAMQTYGLIVADNGSDLYVSGSSDERWNNDELNPAFGSLKAGDFEVVQLGWKPSGGGGGGGPTAPAAPAGLTAQARTSRRIAVAWLDKSNNETSFHLEMRRGGGAFAEIRVLPANSTSFVVPGLAPNTRYSFRVRAQGSAGYSSYSNSATATTPR